MGVSISRPPRCESEAGPLGRRLDVMQVEAAAAVDFVTQAAQKGSLFVTWMPDDSSVHAASVGRHLPRRHTSSGPPVRFEVELSGVRTASPRRERFALRTQLREEESDSRRVGAVSFLGLATCLLPSTTVDSLLGTHCRSAGAADVGGHPPYWNSPAARS